MKRALWIAIGWIGVMFCCCALAGAQTQRTAYGFYAAGNSYIPILSPGTQQASPTAPTSTTIFGFSAGLGYTPLPVDVSGNLQIAAPFFASGASLPATCSAGYVFTLTTTFVPYYCSATNTWTAFGSGGGGGAVSSVFGRTGAVVAVANDYDFSQINSGTNLGHGLVCGTGCVFTTAGTGVNNANELVGTLLTAVTGTGSTAVLSTSPTFTTSIITPSVTSSAASLVILPNTTGNSSLTLDGTSGGANGTVNINGGTGSNTGTGIVNIVGESATGAVNSLINITGGSGSGNNIVTVNGAASASANNGIVSLIGGDGATNTGSTNIIKITPNALQTNSNVIFQDVQSYSAGQTGLGSTRFTTTATTDSNGYVNPVYGELAAFNTGTSTATSLSEHAFEGCVTTAGVWFTGTSGSQVCPLTVMHDYSFHYSVTGGVGANFTIDDTLFNPTTDTAVNALRQFYIPVLFKSTYSETTATIASAATIAPVTSMISISGTAAIVTITLPAGFSTGCIDILATGAWTTTTAGNIFATMTAVANTPYRACYFGTKWFIK